MTESNPNQFEGTELAPTPPQTEHPAVDDALRELSNLASTPLGEHHDRLAKVHEVLREALDRGDEDRSGDAG